jgi:predicted adenine nucleotide alpha hydrolase (AANH) superfamily ATPase
MLENDFEISFYWHNPNIYDKEEYAKRKEAAKQYAEKLGISFFEEEDFVYDYEKWLEAGGEDCSFCYRIRLSKAAEFAENNGFEVFTTSLLSSPYQKHDLVALTGRECAQGRNTSFLYMDFRPEFYEGKNLLRREGYYIQKYCGCAKSYKERFGTK